MTATASEAGDGSWEFDAAIYLWGAGIGGTTAAGGDVDISFSDIMDNLDMAFMGFLEAKKAKWSLYGDLIYMDLSSSRSRSVGSGELPVKLRVGVEARILNGGATYALHDQGSDRIGLAGGARYLWMESKQTLKVGDQKTSLSDSGEVVDAVIGLRGRSGLSDRWFLTYHADIGAGESDLTWQALLGLNYRFKRVDGAFGYRHLEWDFDDGALFRDLDISGPFAGVRFRF